MIQRGHRPRFLLEPAAAVVSAGSAAQDLDGYLARQFRAGVARAVDLSHAAFAKQCDDLVGAESGRV